MTDPRLALLHSDGSMTVLAPCARVAEAHNLCGDCNLREPRRDRVTRVVRIAVEIVEDVFRVDEVQHG